MMRRLFLPLVITSSVLLAAFPSDAASPQISTGDGGWVWQNPLPQGNNLNDVHFINNFNGWAVGDGGTILKTVDGGARWTAQQSGTNQSLWGIAGVDAQTAWAVG
ncbi:MAG TPA: hypothetical protein VJM51_03235, partial [Dehalococcoidia bacterium]|nr:hypothetical protein [Dehalococcoidia bacterium]